MVFAAAWHMAHLMCNQAADGVKFLVRVGAVKLDPKRMLDALNGGVATDAVAAVRQPEDVAFVLGNVKFVLDFAHNFFQHIFNGDQASNATKFVNHDRQVVAVALKIAQQIIQSLALRHKHGRTQQGSNVEFRGTLQLEQVFRHQDANDVFAFTLKHRKTRVRGVDHAVHQGVVRVLNVDQFHAGAGHHDIARSHVGHADHALEHLARICADQLVVLSLDQGVKQLVGRVRSRVDELGNFLQKGAVIFPVGARRVGV